MNDEELRSVLGQLAAYAMEACTIQHRQCFYSILTVHAKASIILQDRSGAIVSGAFGYTKDLRVLCWFLWRFSHVPCSARGVYLTILQLTCEERALFASVPALKGHYEVAFATAGLLWISNEATDA